jgi:hypothetical protein
VRIGQLVEGPCEALPHFLPFHEPVRLSLDLPFGKEVWLQVVAPLIKGAPAAQCVPSPGSARGSSAPSAPHSDRSCSPSC